ncbi:hypothetical protein ASPACDRAFT_128330, partial [Aspergillus aculeatus ATCC 16872]
MPVRASFLPSSPAGCWAAPPRGRASRETAAPSGPRAYGALSPALWARPGLASTPNLLRLTSDQVGIPA